MQIPTLLIVFIILVFILAVLMFFLLQSRKAKRMENEKRLAKKYVKTFTLVDLRNQLKDKKLTSSELKKILDTVLQEYGTIDDFDIYIDIILRMTHHPQVNKEIILGFDKELSRLNPKYKSEIGKNVTTGLSSR